MSDQITNEPIHIDFIQYLSLSRSELLRELADAHQTLARLAIDIAFLKEEEERGVQHARVQRRHMEGTQAAYTEKKWLIKELLSNA